MIQNKRLSTETTTQKDEVQVLLDAAAEAVIGANINPTRLTAEEHTRVTVQQSEALRAATEANVKLIFQPHQTQ